MAAAMGRHITNYVFSPAITMGQAKRGRKAHCQHKQRRRLQEPERRRQSSLAMQMSAPLAKRQMRRAPAFVTDEGEGRGWAIVPIPSIVRFIFKS